jgi:hypothetical protein
VVAACEQSNTALTALRDATPTVSIPSIQTPMSLAVRAYTLGLRAREAVIRRPRPPTSFRVRRNCKVSDAMKSYKALAPAGG